MKQQTGSNLGKEYVKAVYCHPVYLIYIQSISQEMPGGLDEAQAGIKIAGRNINNLRYAYDTILMTASLLAQTVKRLPAIWETWLRSLGQEDPLE